jgi:hypothetical protein
MSAKKQVTEILDDRQGQYGDASDTLQLIADYWSSFLNEITGCHRDPGASRVELTPAEVAQMMVLFKVARAQRGRSAEHGDPTDDMLDTIGYATLAADVRARGLACKPDIKLDRLNFAKSALIDSLRSMDREKNISEEAADDIEDMVLKGSSGKELSEAVEKWNTRGLVSMTSSLVLLDDIQQIIEAEESINALS